VTDLFYSPTAIKRRTENSGPGTDTYWSSGVCTIVVPHLSTQMSGGDPTSASCCARQSDIACVGIGNGELVIANLPRSEEMDG